MENTVHPVQQKCLGSWKSFHSREDKRVWSVWAAVSLYRLVSNNLSCAPSFNFPPALLFRRTSDVLGIGVKKRGECWPPLRWSCGKCKIISDKAFLKWTQIFGNDGKRPLLLPKSTFPICQESYWATCPSSQSWQQVFDQKDEMCF